MPRTKSISDQAVLEAAAKVMFATSPQDFTLAAVATAVGIAPATLLQRFGDKQRLIVAVVKQDNAGFARDLAALPVKRSEAAVIDVFRLLTPNTRNAARFGDGLLWLRQDMRDPDLNRLARERFSLLRRALAQRMPPLAVSSDQAARLIEAQWQGALNQWGIEPDGGLQDFVVRALKAWFKLARRA
jgi:AcrR family transcriptional regulator